MRDRGWMLMKDLRLIIVGGMLIAVLLGVVLWFWQPARLLPFSLAIGSIVLAIVGARRSETLAGCCIFFGGILVAIILLVVAFWP